MAVYTSVNNFELNKFLQQYNLGNLISFKGIVDGIENSNYVINTEKGKFILTLFEKRVNPADLPFFMDLQIHLSQNKFNCPIPIKNRNEKIINTLCNKSAVIISFLEGKQIENPLEKHCSQVGEMIYKFKKITKNFNQFRKNSLSIEKWNQIFNKCLEIKDHNYKEIIDPIKLELDYLSKNWPEDNILAQGIIHADIFKDNVFFLKDEITGLIDFYFSCNDFYAYEIAITTNAWCFNNNSQFNNNNFEAIINKHSDVSNLEPIEKKYFNTLLRGATMRILLTRLHDQLFHPDNAIVIPKDPMEYYNILNFHQNNLIL